MPKNAFELQMNNDQEEIKIDAYARERMRAVHFATTGVMPSHGEAALASSDLPGQDSRYWHRADTLMEHLKNNTIDTKAYQAVDWMDTVNTFAPGVNESKFKGVYNGPLAVPVEFSGPCAVITGVGGAIDLAATCHAIAQRLNKGESNLAQEAPGFLSSLSNATKGGMLAWETLSSDVFASSFKQSLPLVGMIQNIFSSLAMEALTKWRMPKKIADLYANIQVLHAVASVFQVVKNDPFCDGDGGVLRVGCKILLNKFKRSKHYGQFLRVEQHTMTVVAIVAFAVACFAPPAGVSISTIAMWLKKLGHCAYSTGRFLYSSTKAANLLLSWEQSVLLTGGGDDFLGVPAMSWLQGVATTAKPVNRRNKNVIKRGAQYGMAKLISGGMRISDTGRRAICTRSALASAVIARFQAQLNKSELISSEARVLSNILNGVVTNICNESMVNTSEDIAGELYKATQWISIS